MFIQIVYCLMVFSSASLIDAYSQERQKNVGLIVGMLRDIEGNPVAKAVVNVVQVHADDSACSNGLLRIHGPGKRDRSVDSNSKGVFVLAFEWEPEQIGCVTLAPVRAGIKIRAYRGQDYRMTEKWIPLVLIPDVKRIYSGGETPHFNGPIGEKLNSYIKEYAKTNPAIAAYINLISQPMSVELYMLAGDAGVVTTVLP